MELCSAVAVVVAVVTCPIVRGCNVRELSDVIQQRIRQEVAAQCGTVGDKCSFDRECCKGLECKMAAFKSGVDLYCQKAVLEDPDRVDMPWESLESFPNEPHSSEDGAWMLVKSEEDKNEEENNERSQDEKENTDPTDVLTEIKRLQEQKKLKLLKENYELEKLFTERDENELKQLRILKEDAEMDELRRLKELRLKRKLQLIKELKELRGLKAEQDLNKLNLLKNKINSSKTEEQSALKNNTDLLDNNADGSNAIKYAHDDEQLQNTITGNTTRAKPHEQENNTAKHKQGIHQVRHRRRHHHHKKGDPHPTMNATSQFHNKNIENREIATENNVQ